MTAANGGTFVYDGAQNLICANCGNPSAQVQYTYDGNNHRSSVIKSGVKTYEMADNRGNLLIEYTAGPPSKLVEYFYLGGKRIAQRTTP